MGLFSAIKKGLSKTRDALVGELKGIVGAGKITDDTARTYRRSGRFPVRNVRSVW